MQLEHLDYIPEKLADISPRDIKQVFPRPTLINVPGKRDEPVFISTMLHGNETTSFRVLQHLQKRYAQARPARSLMILVGNVDAAEKGMRFLDGQPDFNRCWANGPGSFHSITQQILQEARRRRVFASIDIHNNTGKNPIYGCVNVLRPADLQLSALFSPLGVYYINPSTTQSIAFSRLCPSITVECGQSDEPEGVAAAKRLVDRVIDLDGFDTSAPATDKVRLYQTVSRVMVDPDCTLAFGKGEADLVLREDMEDLNFTLLKRGEVWARTPGAVLPLRVFDNNDNDVTAQYFHVQDGAIVLNQDVTPSMLTPDETIIRQDCLCYFMDTI